MSLGIGGGGGGIKMYIVIIKNMVLKWIRIGVYFDRCVIIGVILLIWKFIYRIMIVM